LARSAAYLDDYEARFSAVISREDYQQTEKGFFLGVPQTWSRKTAAQFLILNAGSGTWLGFRDVFEADGEPVPDRLERLATLLATPATDSARAAALANEIVAESARYNLGSVTRNVNVPTMALVFLRREQQGRSSFHEDGTERTSDNRVVQIVAFTERSRPTLVRSANTRDVPASGRFWIEASGRVDRTELSLAAPDKVKATGTVMYGAQPRLNVWVPLTMREHYEDGSWDKVDAVATYSDFAVPTVSVDVGGFKAALSAKQGGGARPPLNHPGPS
jgi:hypothetical protein